MTGEETNQVKRALEITENIAKLAKELEDVEHLKSSGNLEASFSNLKGFANQQGRRLNNELSSLRGHLNFLLSK